MLSLKSLKKIFPVILFFSACIILAGCGSSMSLMSEWQNNKINIDGDDSDWNNRLAYINEFNTAVGFRNNDSLLYICVSTNDNVQAMQILRNGFMIWLEPERESDNTIGIKYPFNDFMDEKPETGRRFFRPDSQNIEPLAKRLIEKQKELQIFNKDNFPLTLLPVDGNTEGFKAALGYKNHRFTYELEVPLKKENASRYGLGAEPGDKISVSFISEERERKDLNRPGNGMGGGMRPGEGMPGIQGPGGGRRPENPNKPRILPPEPINLNVEVTLKSYVGA